MTAAHTALRLRSDVHINVAYDDHTYAGSPVGDRPDRAIRSLFPNVSDHARHHGYSSLISNAASLLREGVAAPAFQQLTAPGRRSADASSWRVADEVLYPDPDLAPPRRLTVASTDRNRIARATVPIESWPEVHDCIAALEHHGLRPADVHDEDVRAFIEALATADLATPAATESGGSATERRGEGVTFLGHNTVVFRSATTSLLLDPLLFAERQENPFGYQPLGVRDTGPPDAVLLTHTHRDHADAASLLRLPTHTPVIIPTIDRETILSIDLHRRLTELGFTNVIRLAWGGRTVVGDIEVHALPFYGEQPTDGATLHPEIRNEGNTYLLRSPMLAAVFLADAGRDGAGAMHDVAASLRRDGDAGVDVVFVGYRGWVTYPVQLLFSSIARYLWFVPPWLWESRMQLMLGPDDAVDLAERFGSRFVVPYADGGAPWHWNIGLGPRLDGSGTEVDGFDLFPERVIDACTRRVQFVDGSRAASPVRPLLMRPGDCVTAHDLIHVPPVPNVHRSDGHAWPW